MTRRGGIGREAVGSPVADVLNKVPPFQLGKQIIAEAQRLPGVSSAALYVLDFEGASLQRLAGAETFPAQVTAPLAVGPEVPREGVAAIRAVFEDLLPGATVAPLQLRGRAIGILLAVGTATAPLRDLASEAAVDYTENPRGTWIGIADSQGTGPSAAGIGAVTLGAFRSVRRESDDPRRA